MKAISLIIIAGILLVLGALSHEVDMCTTYNRTHNFNSKAFWLNWDYDEK